jgi:hypothetical protein
MTPQAEFGPDVFHPTDEDHDPDRVIRDAHRNSLIAKGAALAENAGYAWVTFCEPMVRKWSVMRQMDSGPHKHIFYGATLADALIALAEAVGDA